MDEEMANYRIDDVPGIGPISSSEKEGDKHQKKSKQMLGNMNEGGYMLLSSLD